MPYMHFPPTLLKADVLNFYLIPDSSQSVCSDLVSVKLKRAYCCDNFLAQRPLPGMHGLSRDNFLCFNRTAPQCISTRHHHFPGARERDARNASSSRRLSPCTRSTFRARILTILSRSVMTTNNSAK